MSNTSSNTSHKMNRYRTGIETHSKSVIQTLSLIRIKSNTRIKNK
jgi:hypothetical protein